MLLALAGAAGWILFDREWALVLMLALLLLLWLQNMRHIARLVRWTLESVGTPVPRAQGVWDYVFASLARRSREAHEQRERLARTLTRFREASQALPDGVIYLSNQHTIEWVNASAAAFFALDASRDVGQPITNLVRDPAFVAYLADPQRKAGEPLLVRGAGQQAGLTLAVQVIPFGEDQEMVLARDITLSERLDAMRRDFVANVSHELKTPLTVVNGFVETVLDADEDISSQERRHYLELALQQSQRMQHLVEDLLTLSALQAGARTAENEVVDALALVRGVAAEAEVLSAGRHRIRLEVAGEVSLLGSQKELHSAFSNLVSNAVRYTPEGGEIVLRWLLAADASARFEVQDSGIGIAPEHIERLTERFYRVDQGRSRDSGGTGLGLAIVKHVLTRHQARLEIRSKPGEGSRFSALFPPQRLQLPRA